MSGVSCESLTFLKSFLAAKKPVLASLGPMKAVRSASRGGGEGEGGGRCLRVKVSGLRGRTSDVSGWRGPMVKRER